MNYCIERLRDTSLNDKDSKLNVNITKFYLQTWRVEEGKFLNDKLLHLNKA